MNLMNVMNALYDRKVNHKIEEEKKLTGCIRLLSMFTIHKKHNEL